MQEPMPGDAAPGWLARHRGGVALSISALGFIAAEGVALTGVLSAPWAAIPVTAFEGALVGSIADWFAVSALFRQIPIPLLRRHTGLIAKRRPALSRGIVDMVENEWLSPAALREHLQKVSMADLVTQRLSHGEGREKLRRITRRQSLKLTGWLAEPRVEALAEGLLGNIVKRINAGEQLAPLLRRLARDQALEEQLWQGAIGLLDRILRDPHLLGVLTDIMLDQLDTLSNEGRWSSVKVWLGKQFLEGEGDRDKAERLLRRLLDRARSHLADIVDDRDHALRLRMRALLVVTARHLENDADSRLNQVLERSKWQLYSTFSELKGSRSWLDFARRWLDERIQEEGSELNHYIDKAIDELIERQLVQPQARQRFDERVRRWIGELIDDHPDFIGNIARESLSEARLPTQQLVTTIEERVGPDLQWIRVNGAVVGGAAALLIGVIRALSQYMTGTG